MTSLKFLRRFFPVLAFLGGFAWDALAIGPQQDFGLRSQVSVV